MMKKNFQSGKTLPLKALVRSSALHARASGSDRRRRNNWNATLRGLGIFLTRRRMLIPLHQATQFKAFSHDAVVNCVPLRFRHWMPGEHTLIVVDHLAGAVDEETSDIGRHVARSRRSKRPIAPSLLRGR
jgi:hypothetical protein